MLQTVGRRDQEQRPERRDRDRRPPDSCLSGAIRLQPYLKALYKGGGSSAFDTVAINSYAVSPKYLGKLMNTTRKS